MLKKKKCWCEHCFLLFLFPTLFPSEATRKHMSSGEGQWTTSYSCTISLCTIDHSLFLWRKDYQKLPFGSYRSHNRQQLNSAGGWGELAFDVSFLQCVFFVSVLLLWLINKDSWAVNGLGQHWFLLKPQMSLEEAYCLADQMVTKVTQQMTNRKVYYCSSKHHSGPCLPS